MANAIFDAATAQHAALLEICPIVQGAIVSKPLLNLPQGRAVLFAMDTGQIISEHKAPYVATVHILEGRLRFEVEGQTREMTQNDWLVMPPNAPHALTALEPTRFLLTLFKAA